MGCDWPWIPVDVSCCGWPTWSLIVATVNLAMPFVVKYRRMGLQVCNAWDWLRPRDVTVLEVCVSQLVYRCIRATTKVLQIMMGKA